MTVDGEYCHGGVKGEYGITVTGNWRIIFRLQDNTINDVNFEDYHSETETMAMKNPPHPGEIIREEIIETLGLTVTSAAEFSAFVERHCPT